MDEKELHFYQIFINDGGYVSGFSVIPDDKLENKDEYEYIYYGQMGDYPDIKRGWYKYINGEFIVDEAEKRRIIERERERALEPTRTDKIESQLFYTALVTDTLIEETE